MYHIGPQERVVLRKHYRAYANVIMIALFLICTGLYAIKGGFISSHGPLIIYVGWWNILMAIPLLPFCLYQLFFCTDKPLTLSPEGFLYPKAFKHIVPWQQLESITVKVFCYKGEEHRSLILKLKGSSDISLKPKQIERLVGSKSRSARTETEIREGQFDLRSGELVHLFKTYLTAHNPDAAFTDHS